MKIMMLILLSGLLSACGGVYCWTPPQSYQQHTHRIEQHETYAYQRWLWHYDMRFHEKKERIDEQLRFTNPQ